MNCPICLYGLSNSIAFGCGHSCCQRCVEVSEIQICPICRQKITTTTPSPWLDWIDQSQDQNNFLGTEAYYFSKPILDPRGVTLRQGYYNALKYIVEPVSQLPSIMEKAELAILLLKQAHESEVKKLQDNINAKIHETRALVEKEDAKIKEQDYCNQGFSHSAMTFLALSIQPTEVLNQAFPVYQQNLELLNHKWALNILPYHSGKPMNGEHYLYVPQHDSYFYSEDKSILFGDKSVSVFSWYPIVRVKYCNDLFYVMKNKGHEYNMYVYDVSLMIINILPCSRNQIDFYMHGSKIIPVFIVKTTGLRSTNIHNYQTTFYDNVIKITGIIDSIEVFEDVLYIHDSHNNRTYMYDRTGNCIIKNCKFVVYPDYVLFYKHVCKNETSITMRDGTEQIFKGHGIFYPNFNNMAIYQVKDGYQKVGTLCQLK